MRWNSSSQPDAFFHRGSGGEVSGGQCKEWRRSFLVFTSDSHVAVRVVELQNHPGGGDPAMTLALVPLVSCFSFSAPGEQSPLCRGSFCTLRIFIVWIRDSGVEAGLPVVILVVQVGVLPPLRGSELDVGGTDGRANEARRTKVRQMGP
ncbi:uncharacterized [Tachysurus ichikawai]